MEEHMYNNRLQGYHIAVQREVGMVAEPFRTCFI